MYVTTLTTKTINISSKGDMLPFDVVCVASVMSLCIFLKVV